MRKVLAFLFSFIFLFPNSAFAHEAYVLTRDQFQAGLKTPTTNPMGALIDSSHLQLFLIISVVVATTFTLIYLFSTTKISQKLDEKIRKFAKFGPLTIRLVMATVFFLSALENSIFGPELSLSLFPGGEIVRIMLFIISFMLFFGVFVELAALFSLGIFLYMINQNGIYMLTYVNYLGEILVLMFFGSKTWSLDKFFFGAKRLHQILEKYSYLEIPVVRVLFGIALIYTAISVKFQHQILPIEVYNQYNLKQFFQQSASFVAAGAGLTELMIGASILLGFAMRTTLVIFVCFITLSLLYFGEIVWPHLMLYGISISLFINSADKFTIDRYFVPFVGRTLAKIKAKL